jgi:hypothetical protein
MTDTVKFEIDTDRFREVVMPRLFASVDTIVRELIQNSRRAGATEIRITYPFMQKQGPWVLVVEDNGCGEADMSRFLNACSTGWSKAIVDKEMPAGLGFMSVFMAASHVSVESLGKRLAFNCQSVLTGGSTQIELADKFHQQGVKVTCTFVSNPEFSSEQVFEATQWQTPDCYINGNKVSRLDPWTIMYRDGSLKVEPGKVYPEASVVTFETDNFIGYIRTKFNGHNVALWEGFRVDGMPSLTPVPNCTYVTMCKSSQFLRLPDRTSVSQSPAFRAEIRSIADQVIDRIREAGATNEFRPFLASLTNEKAVEALNAVDPVLYRIEYTRRAKPGYRIDILDGDESLAWRKENLPDGAIIIRSPDDTCSASQAQFLDALAFAGLAYTTDGYRLDQTDLTLEEVSVKIYGDAKPVTTHVNIHAGIVYVTLPSSAKIAFATQSNPALLFTEAVALPWGVRDPLPDFEQVLLDAWAPMPTSFPENGIVIISTIDPAALTDRGKILHAAETCLAQMLITEDEGVVGHGNHSMVSSQYIDLAKITQLNNRLDDVQSFLLSFRSPADIVTSLGASVRKALAPYAAVLDVDGLEADTDGFSTYTFTVKNR